MSVVAFWLYTLVAGTAFVVALLWVIAQWMKADQETTRTDETEEERADHPKAA